MDDGRFELFEHTADVGLRIQAPDLNTLFAQAGRALLSVMVANLDEVRATQSIAIELAGDEIDNLLFDWLAELLYLFATRQIVFGRFHVQIGEGKLNAIAEGEPIDHARHVFDVEVKAITYHGLRVEPQGDTWLAEVIVDI